MSNDNSGKIGVSTATITGMNAMIGAGIFAVPAALAASIGPAGILTVLFVVIAAWFMAQSIARVAYLVPEEGSFYAYTKQWGGHVMGLLSGGAYILGLAIALGLLSHMAGKHLLYFFPNISPNILGFIALSLLVALNMFGVALSQLGQRILICTTVFPLLTTIIMCLTKADFSLLTPFAPYGYANVAAATRVAIFGFFGFESAASLFSVVKNPEKNVPRAVTYSITLVGILYTLFVASIIIAVPLTLFSSPDTPLAETLTLVFPNAPWITTAIHVAILSAILGTIHSIIWGSSSLVIALTKKFRGNFVKNLVKTQVINQKTSVLFIGICTFISYATIKNMDLFFDFTVICLVFAFISSMITLLIIKKEWTSGRNIKTIIGIGTALLIFGFAAQDVKKQLTRKDTQTTHISQKKR